MRNSSADTRQSLLLRIRDTGDQSAWREFVAIYAPLIHAYGLRNSLQDADAADVAQQVLEAIWQAIPSFVYDHSKGSFRGWLFTLTRHRVLKVLRNQRRQARALSDEAAVEGLAQLEDREEDERLWNLEHHRQLFHWAAEKARIDFKPTTWQAFWEVAVDGKSVAQVASKLDLSPGAVYIAKCRVTTRIRQWIDSLESRQ